MKWLLVVLGLVAGLVLAAAIVGALLPRDHVAASRITLRQAPGAVWPVVRNFGAVPEWWKDVTASVRQPDANGHERWQQTVGGFEMPLVIEAEEPPARLVTRIAAGTEAGFGGTWTYRIAEIPGGAEVTVTESGFIANPFVRVLSRFVFGLHRNVDGYLAALAARFGEAQTPAHVAAT